MEEQHLNIDHDKVLEALINAFGNILSKDVFLAIIETCGGDLQQSANAVMSITMDAEPASENKAQSPQENDSNCNSNLIDNRATSTMQNVQPETNTSRVPMAENTVTSYASASQVNKPRQQVLKPSTSNISTSNTPQNLWTNQLRQILAYNENGARILILMRGVPGSGKSYLAKKIVDAMYYTELHQNYFSHILSTDHFFMQGGVYMFNKYRLSEAHTWNQNRARLAMRQGVSPIIIDNTNIEPFEMEPYLFEGVRNGYIIEVVEPNTPWAKKANQLVKRNTHNVPIHTIKRMLDNYEQGITGAFLMRRFNCYYDHRMQPPVLRNIPPILQRPEPISNSLQNEARSLAVQNNEAIEIEITELPSQDVQPSTSHKQECVVVAEERICQNSEKKELQTDDSNEAIDKADQANDKHDTEILKTVEEFEKLDIQWENGESWDENTSNNAKTNDEPSTNSKPQRKNKGSRSTTAEKLLPAEVCHDWSKMFLPSWADSNTSSVAEQPSSVVEKVSCGTCIEGSDIDTSNLKHSLKIITTTPRNINEFHMESANSKIPEKWMLDKSTSTNNNEVYIDSQRCKNEEKHFKSFRNLFKHVARSDLRDIFDNCCGDVNWAVEIVLDGVENNKLDVVTECEDDSDTEYDSQNVELCQCLSAYGILPAVNEPVPKEVEPENVDKTSSPSMQMKKPKKETVVSEASLELKRQIEQNVVIPDSHYSPHHLKIRKNRHCEDEGPEVVKSDKNVLENSDQPNNVEQPSRDIDIPSTSENKDQEYEDKNAPVPSTSKAYNNNETSDEESYIGVENVEDTVNIELGEKFIAQLDHFFGRTMEYPENVIHKINMPISILNEINALWIESLMHQLEENNGQSKVMVIQDQEFARELALKEAELSRAGKEPAVPDFREIMDLDFALSLYQKDVDEMRKNIPQDMAAKLSRDKLYSLFPDIPKDTLSELLAAHSENFKSTVEMVLLSTGKGDILKDENGLNKFVVEREIQCQQAKLDQEAKKSLSEAEWPLLKSGKRVEMYHVEGFRNEAELHLQTRNLHYRKAQEYMSRGMTQVATYYSSVAAHYKRKFEQANCMAAATLMQMHASHHMNSSTIDLHFLRVCEARETLDLFIDSHIQRLRESQHRNPGRHTLYLITGRGLHSNGLPKIKPAIKRRLRERGLVFRERNPGLLEAKVSASNNMTYQVV